MNTTKNKLLAWLLVLLLIANVASIAMFWFGKGKPPRPQAGGTPAAFLQQALQFDSMQQRQFELLRKEHQDAAAKIREQVKDAKEAFFLLLKQPDAADSTKQQLVKAISVYTEKLDLLTLNHFEKLRAICTVAQQKKFDEIIVEVARMINLPRPMGPPNNRQQSVHPDANHPPPVDVPDGEGPPPIGSAPADARHLPGH